MFIKTIGIQRTGTNYIDAILTTNTEAKMMVNYLGWKHGYTWRDMVEWCRILEETPLNEKAKAIITIKHPYTWFHSINKWNILCGGKFQPPDVLFKRYNDIYKDHKEFLKGKIEETIYDDGILVRYEDLLKQPEETIEMICSKFNLYLSEPIQFPTKVSCSNKFTEEDRNFYLNMKPKSHKDEINKAVDWELMAFYKYYKE